MSEKVVKSGDDDDLQEYVYETIRRLNRLGERLQALAEERNGSNSTAASLR